MAIRRPKLIKGKYKRRNPNPSSSGIGTVLLVIGGYLMLALVFKFDPLGLFSSELNQTIIN